MVRKTLAQTGEAAAGTGDAGDAAAQAQQDAELDQSRELGHRIREVRRKKKMTLRDAAVAAGVSESFLSQVERGLANPSVASLRRIADAMNEQVASFFVGEPQPGMLVRAGERRRLVHPMGGLEDYLLTPATARSLQIIYCVVGPGEGSGPEPYTHVADEECVLVLDGQLDVGLGTETFALGSGDTLLLDPKEPHSFRNPGTERATVLWVQTPPLF